MTGAAAIGAIEAAIRVALGRPIGPDENFFDAGLTSHTLVRAYTEGTSALAVPPPVTALFAHPTLRALRRHLAVGPPDAPPVRVAPRGARASARERRDLRRRARSPGGPT